MYAKRTIAFCCLLLFFTSAFHTIASTHGSEQECETLDGWWSRWVRDGNQDGIDDLLEDWEYPAKVLVNYCREPTYDDVSRLEALGARIHYRCRYINTIIVDGVAKSMLGPMSRLPGVVMLEADTERYLNLDVATRAVKARASDLYPSVWENLGYDGSGVNIAVLDSGVDDALHTSFPPGKFVGGADFSGRVYRLDTNPADDDGHGTHVAGTALGTGGGSEHIGTAPGSGLVDVKVANSMGFTQQSRMIAAYEWCLDNRERHRISVVSVSMGSRDDSDGGGAECELVNKMVDSGIVFIAAIGNTGDRFVGAPASADKAIAVGAIDDMNTVSRDDDVIAAYSSFGPRKSGDSVESSDLKPEIVAPGTNIMAPKHNSMGAYVTMSGTSMATPMVSATAAMMLEANPFLSTDQIRNILTQTAERRGTATYPEIDQDWNYQYGWGMLDAHGAVSLAMETTPHPPNPTIPYVDRESVVVSWDEYMGTGFTSYSIHFNLADGGPATEETFSINNKTTTQQTITGLQEDTEYQLQVKYVTWSGELAGNTLFFTTNETGFIGSNQPPSAHIISITPSDSTEGETVHFQGYGEDVDGTVEEYRWSSSLDGLLSDQPEFFHSGLRPGYHTISFRVRDNRGEWSQEDTKRITVRDASGTIPDISQPSISITSPTQSQAIPREGVLEIRGTAHGSPQIVSVSIGIDNTSWVSVQSLVKTSDSEGETASWAHLISLESLPVGGHTIHVRVYDGTHASYAQVDFVLVEVEEPDQDGFFAMLQNPFCLVPALLIFLALILAIALVARKIKRYNTSSYKGPGQL